MKLETVLPLFTGFYYSIFNLSEHWWDLEFEYLTTEEGMSDSKATDYLQKCDRSKANKAVSQTIAECFETLWNSNFSVRIKIDYLSLESPRQYNFSTDRILINVEFDEREMINLLDENFHFFEKFLENNFTSHSGFISHYSNDVEKWNVFNLSGWDCNEVWALLSSLCELKGLDSMSLYEECDFRLLEEYSNNVVYPSR